MSISYPATFSLFQKMLAICSSSSEHLFLFGPTHGGTALPSQQVVTVSAPLCFQAKLRNGRQTRSIMVVKGGHSGVREGSI